LRLWMATSDIGIIPSMSEWFCYTAVQMQSMGLPLIVSKVGALPEVLKSNHTFIWYGKIKELSNAINKNLSQPIHKYQSEDLHTSINYQEYYDLFEQYKQ
jgi:glycosyltransferase involved in cell wall biosynthesis